MNDTQHTDYGDVGNHIHVHASGHQLGKAHNGFDVAMTIIAALVAFVAIMAIFVLGLLALPFVAVIAVAWLAKEVLS